MSQKNQWYVWVLMCGEDYGWGAVYDGLWGYEPRVYRTRSEAVKRRDACLNAGCWVDDDGNEQIPEFYIERMTIFRAIGIPAIEDEVRAIMPPAGSRIPAKVLRDAAAGF